MTDAPLATALLLWNSNLNDGLPAFAVRPLGHEDYDRFDYQNGACFRSWREANDADRRVKLMVEIWHIVAFYGVPADMVHRGLLVIPEYRDLVADDWLLGQFQHERE